MQDDAYVFLANNEDNHWWNVSRRKLVESCLAQVGTPSGGVGLDIGCGTGGNLGLLSKFCSSVVGLDFSPLALQLAKARYPDGRFVLGDANNTRSVFKNEVFHLITLFNVLYHKWIIDDVDVLRQIYEITEQDGYVVITEGAFEALYRKHDMLAMGVRRYTIPQMRKMLEDAGFTVELSTYFNSVSFVPAFIIAMLERARSSRKNADVDVMELRELKNPHSIIGRAVTLAMDVERLIIRRAGKVPFGVSLLCLAKKRGVL